MNLFIIRNRYQFLLRFRKFWKMKDRIQTTQMNFSGGCEIRATIFLERYFHNRKKNWKSSYGFWKIDKFIWHEIGEGTVLGHPLPWTILFFLNAKKINIFRLMHIALFLKVTY